MDKVFLKIREMRFELPEGTVIGIARLEPIKKGWIVRMSFGQNLEGSDGMHVAVMIASDTTKAISGWRDEEENEFWDVVDVFQDEDQATIAGKENGQMSIYQIETGRLKWID